MAEGTTLPAGRELDALVAEKVMGWSRERGSAAGTTEWHPDAVMLVSPETPNRWRRHPTTAPVTYRDNLPRYSTDIAAAWEVVGTLHGNPERWEAFDAELRETVLPAMHARHLHELEVSRAAYAICRAALATLPPAGAR